MEIKKAIRARILKERASLSDETWHNNSETICNKVISTSVFLTASTVYAYLDFKREVCTKSIIEAAFAMGKQVAVPKIEKNEMNFYYIKNFQELEEGYFHILEPTNKRPAACEDALVIVPGVAFDYAKNRIGYGKGFYDKYLSEHTNHTTIAIAFSMQCVQTLDAEPFDVKVQQLITEDMHL